MTICVLLFLEIKFLLIIFQYKKLQITMRVFKMFEFLHYFFFSCGTLQPLRLWACLNGRNAA